MKTLFFKLSILFISFFFGGLCSTLSAQIWIEPKLDEVNKIGTPYDKGVRQGMGVDLVLNNFGFSLGTQYRYMFSSEREFTVSFSIGTLRDVSEQTFTTIFSEIIPNKFQRVISMPLTIGFKQRLLSNRIQDNFRVHLQTSAGPSFAFTYPYFSDFNNDGIRQTDYDNYEPVHDALSAWGKGHFEYGIASELMLGIDFGSNKINYSTVRFGISGHYFPNGIQIMEARTAPKQKLFLSPQFNLVIGGFWK